MNRVKLHFKSVEEAEIILNKLSNNSAQLLFVTQKYFFL